MAGRDISTAPIPIKGLGINGTENRCKDREVSLAGGCA